MIVHVHPLVQPPAHPGIVITNDGNAILREIDVSHPAAKVWLVCGVMVQAETPMHTPSHTPQSIIQLSRTQDEEVGDGTTSVIILGMGRCVHMVNILHDLHQSHPPTAGEMLHAAEPFLENNIHPTVIVRAYFKALEDAIKIVDSMAFPIDVQNREQMLNIVQSCIGTKFTTRFGTLMAVCTLYNWCTTLMHTDHQQHCCHDAAASIVYDPAPPLLLGTGT